MRHHTEIELKWALDADGHAALGRALTAALGPGTVLDQENRFLDSPDLRLRRVGLNLRLRREGGRVLMTGKRRMTSADGATRHEEWEDWLDLARLPGLAVIGRPLPPGLAPLLPLPAPHREALAGADLVDTGGFANRRVEYHAPAGDLLCLDRTDFGVRIDHELEIETEDPARASTEWSARLATWGVRWTPQPLTKFARMLGLAGAAKA